MDGGFIESVATGAHASAEVTAIYFPLRNPPFGIATVTVTSPGFGYNSPPTVNVIHPTGENAILSAIMGPSPIFGDEVRSILIENEGTNYNPIELNKVVFTGGLGVESDSFSAISSDSDGEIVRTEFVCAGGGFFWKFTDRTLPHTKQSGRPSSRRISHVHYIT